ncbi:MAG: hypothetical protein QE263_04200 [Vampirovibrionales bacterium]|nr:hypothetical protein [Vampirovibrionales bacterium]
MSSYDIDPALLASSLKERAALMADLQEHRGWQLLAALYRPEVKTRVLDVDDHHAFVYEATRAQAFGEVFSTPDRVIRQYRKETGRLPRKKPPMDSNDS